MGMQTKNLTVYRQKFISEDILLQMSTFILRSSHLTNVKKQKRKLKWSSVPLYVRSSPI